MDKETTECIKRFGFMLMCLILDMSDLRRLLDVSMVDDLNYVRGKGCYVNIWRVWIGLEILASKIQVEYLSCPFGMRVLFLNVCSQVQKITIGSYHGMSASCISCGLGSINAPNAQEVWNSILRNGKFSDLVGYCDRFQAVFFLGPGTLHVWVSHFMVWRSP